MIGFDELDPYEIFDLDCVTTSAKDDLVFHAFPLEFEEHSIFHKWKHDWLMHCYTTKKKMFHPPLLPKICFQGENLSVIPYTSHRLSNDMTFGCIVLSEGKVVMGSVKWSRWGLNGKTNGTDFRAIIRNRDNTYTITCLEIRPYIAEPYFVIKPVNLAEDDGKKRMRRQIEGISKMPLGIAV